VLADLRPNTKMLADMDELFGRSAAIESAAGTVPREWREAHVLRRGRLEAKGELAYIDSVRLRRRLERKHARLLSELGMDHLDISEVRSRTRPVTQAISRTLYEEGAAGVRFKSNLDDQPCFALFEGRARLAAERASHDTLVRLRPDEPLLVRVCDELGLRLTDLARDQASRAHDSG
jgi:RES domain